MKNVVKILVFTEMNGSNLFHIFLSRGMQACAPPGQDSDHLVCPEEFQIQLCLISQGMQRTSQRKPCLDLHTQAAMILPAQMLQEVGVPPPGGGDGEHAKAGSPGRREQTFKNH